MKNNVNTTRENISETIGTLNKSKIDENLKLIILPALYSSSFVKCSSYHNLGEWDQGFGSGLPACAQVVFKVGYGKGWQVNVDYSMTINRMSMGKRTLMFSFYFKFNINALANIWTVNKFSHIIAKNFNIVYFIVFAQWLNIPLEKITY